MEFKPYRDFHSHTCLASIAEGHVRMVRINDTRLEVSTTSEKEFARSGFVEIQDYPVKKAVRHFVAHAKAFGATVEVVKILNQIEPISAEDKADLMKDQPEEEKNSSGHKTAAKMFRALILEGELSDDEIFKAVQEAFGLDDNRRSYVKWYRNELKKKGLIDG